jgi:hypothetical protein
MPAEDERTNNEDHLATTKALKSTNLIAMSYLRKIVDKNLNNAQSDK